MKGVTKRQADDQLTRNFRGYFRTDAYDASLNYNLLVQAVDLVKDGQSWSGRLENAGWMEWMGLVNRHLRSKHIVSV